MRSKLWLVWAALGLGILAFYLWSLLRYPPYFVDEGWFASRAWAFAQTGRAFGPLDRGVFEELNGHWTFFPWLAAVLQAAVLAPLDQPSIFALRLFSLGCGLVVAAEIFVIARRLGGTALARLSLLFLSLSYGFFTSTHLARYDIMTAMFGFGALALFMINQYNNPRPRIGLSFLCGLLAMLAMEIHSYGIIYVPTIGLLYLGLLRWRFWRDRQLWAYVAGCAAALLAYAGLHILRYPAEYFSFYRLTFGPTHTPPIATLDPAVLAESFQSTLQLGPLIFAAIALALPPRPPYAAMLAGMALALTTMFALVVRNKFHYYMVLYHPLLHIVAAAAALHLYHTLAARYKRPLALAVRAVVAAGVLVWLILDLPPITLADNAAAQYATIDSQLLRGVKPDDRIMAQQIYWFTLYDHQQYSPEQLIFYQRFHPELDLRAALGILRPDIVVIDTQFRFLMSKSGNRRLYAEHLSIPEGEMLDFLRAHGEIINQFTSSDGPITVYRLRWD